MGGKQQKTLVFMAFGDSLTVGYQSPTDDDPWPTPAPYTEFLKPMTERMLHEMKADHINVEFLNRGVNGELTSEMTRRFFHDVLGSRPAFVVILGGSNDLGWGVGPAIVAKNLSVMYRQSLDHHIRPISCTIPSVLGYDDGIPPRTELNLLIRKASEALGISCVDLYSATSDSDGRLRAEYSNDGLHMSRAGYEAVALALFSDAVKGFVLDHVRAS